MNIDAEVSVLRGLGLAGVKADPNAHLLAAGPGMSGKRPLDGQSGGCARLRPVEDAEVLVSAAVDLSPPFVRDCIGDERSGICQQPRIIVAEPSEQAGRVFDVAEKERQAHRSGSAARTSVPRPRGLSISR